MEEYDSQSIKVMKEEEMVTFPWYLIEVLAERYTSPLEVVKRGVESAYQSGVDVSYFEDRYLKGDRSIPENETFTNTYKEMLLKDRDMRWL